MFKQKFKSLIQKFLGEFVEDFDDKYLRVDNWSGQVTQTQLNLKPGSLKFLSIILGIDISVVRGIIGSLQISFNWRALWKEPIQLTLEDLYIVCKPVSPPDPSIFQATLRNQKRAKIDDMLPKAKVVNPNKTYFQQLEATIVDNLCVSLKNVHIRFEDTCSNPFRPFVIGLTLEKLNYSPADSTWKKSFVTLESKKIAEKSFMVLELSQFSVYHVSKCSDLFHSKQEWLRGISNEKFKSLMYPYIAHRDFNPVISEYYILRPVNTEIRIRRSLKSPLESEIPKLSVSILVDEIACALEANQYQDLLMLASVMSLHKAVGTNIHLRPSNRPKANAKGWWAYITELVRQKVRKKIVPLTWQYLDLRKNNKTEYIQIYQHLLHKEYETEYGRSIGNFAKIPKIASLSVKELENKMMMIEDAHSIEEIFLFRCVAEKELLNLKESKKKGWIEWGKGWFKSYSAEEETFLKSLVEYSELISIDNQATVEYLKYFINFELKKCSISLEGRHLTGARASFLKISLYQAVVHKIITPSSTKVFSALSSLKIIDPFTPIDRFRNLFKQKNIDESFLECNPSFEIEEEIFPEENNGFPEFASHDPKITPLFKLVYDDTKMQDMSLKVLFQPIEIVYNKFCIERITGFLTIPEVLALYESIEIQTMNQLASWKMRTQARLDFLLKNQMKLNIDVSISAPLIIIPENTLNEDTSQILLNTGDLKITSNPRVFSELNFANRKNSDIDEGTYYDHFDIQISDISVGLLPPESSLVWNIIEKFNISMTLSKSIIPKDPQLTTFKIKGEIQSLTAKLSRIQYLLLQQYSFISEEIKQPEFKQPVDEDEDSEFYDACEYFDNNENFEEIVTEIIKFPHNKEHLKAEFSINSMKLMIMNENDDKEILSLIAKDLAVVFVNEEAKKKFGVKLGYILVKDWIEKRAIIESNQDASELILMEIYKYLENHPDYHDQEFHTQVGLSVSNLHVNYYDEPIRLLLSLFQIQSPSIPKINANIIFRAILNNVSCKISDGNKDISELHLQSADISHDSCNNLSTELGQITIKDYIHDKLFFETMSKSLLSLKIVNSPEEKIMECSVNSFKILVATPMIMTLSDLFQKSALKSYIKIQGKSEKKAFDKISLELTHPLFEFFSYSSNHGSCVFDLGEVDFRMNINEIVARFNESNIYTLINQDEEVLKDMVLYDFYIEVTAELPNVKCFVPSISVSSSAQHLKFLKKIFNEYLDQIAYLQQLIRKKNVNADNSDEKKNISESLAHGVIQEQEKLNLYINLQKACVSWALFSASVGMEKVKIIANFSNILCHLIEKKNSTWAKAEIEYLNLECIGQETLRILFPRSNSLATIGLQILPDKKVLDLSINSPRFVITPNSMHAFNRLFEEINSFTLKSSNKSETFISGEINNLQIVVTSDSCMVTDDEHFQSPLEFEQKKFCMIQFSGAFQNTNIRNEEFFIIIGKSCNFEEELHGKYLLYPLKFQVSKETDFDIKISEVNIDFSLNHVPYFSEIYQKFMPFSSNQPKKYKKTGVKLQIQQVLLSISHDFTIQRNSTNNYFIIQLDFPMISFKDSFEMSSQLAIFYYNQQFFGWEPFIERSDLMVIYSFMGKQKKFEVKSSDQVNFNVSSSLISTCSNFWKGIQQHKILENIQVSASPKQPTHVYSGFAIKNETGQKLRYWIENKNYSLSNSEEHSLEFEEIEEEQAASVIMFKNNMKAKKAYRIKTITVKIGELAKINDICIDKLGCKLFNISQQGSHFQVICEVSSRHGDNLLTIKSPIQLKNMLKESIDIRLIYSLAQNKLNEEDYYSTIVIPPQSTLPLPIERSHFSEFQLKIKGYGWSVRKGINNLEPLTIECPHKPMNSFEISSQRKHLDECKIAYSVFKQSQIELKDENEKFTIKMLTFEAPFSIENCLCCDLEYLCKVQYSDIKAHGLLNRGEVFNYLEINPNADITLALRIPGYDWTTSLEIVEETKQIFQFSKKYSEQINVVLEASKKEGVYKLVLFSQYWLENHTGLPLLFKYMENDFSYDIISLPYVIEGVYIEERNDKKKGLLHSMFSAFGEKLEIEEENIKPWMRYKEQKKVGLGSLLDDEEMVDEGQGTIRMFSSDVSNPVQGMVSIKLANSQWSKVFKLIGNEAKKDLLTTAGHSIQALEEVSSSKRSCIYEIAMTMEIGEEPFSRTKIIRFTPRFVLINKMSSVLLISQYEPNIDLTGVCRLMPNERSAYHWADFEKSRAVCIRPESYGWQWSGQFYIEGPEDFVIRIRNSSTHEEILAHIAITLEESTLHIIFTDTSHLPPYRIENLSMETLSLCQIDSKIPEKILKPFEVCGYAWDLPLSKKLLKVLLYGQSTNSYVIGKFKLDSQEDVKKINLRPHGSHPSHPLYIEVTNSGSTKVLIFRHEMTEEDDVINNRESGSDDLCISIKLASIGVSVINSSPEEIIFVSLNEVNCQIDRSYSEISGDFSIRSGQIDNQLYKACNPVMMSMIENNQLLVRVEFKKRQSTVRNKKISKQEVDYFKYLKISMAPIDIRIDSLIIETIINFITDTTEMLSQILIRDIEVEKKNFQHYYFDKVLIGSLSVNISFVSMPFMLKNMDIVNPVRMIFIIFGNIGNVFLEFKQLRLNHRHLTLAKLKRELTSFYLSQCKNQIINILYSSDAIGNPNELIRHLRVGLIDLLTLSGELSITGLFKGMSSFVQHSIFGASNSMYKLFESFKKGMYTMYIDDEKQRSLVSNLFLATTRTILLIPNIAISMASSTANHIRDAVQQQHALIRKRPPRSFLTSRLLTVYSYSESVGQYVLSMVEHGKYLTEGIKHHLSSGDTVIVVTSKRILRAVVEEFKPIWQVFINAITLIKVETTTLVMYYIKDDSIGFEQQKIIVNGEHSDLQRLKTVLDGLRDL